MKRIKISFLVLVGLYILTAIWAARDTEIVLQKAMQTDSDYSAYLTPAAYKAINPLERELKADYSFKADSHKIGFPIVLHYFWKAHVLVSHTYDDPENKFGLIEPMTIHLKLTKGKWQAQKIDIGDYVSTYMPVGGTPGPVK